MGPYRPGAQSSQAVPTKPAWNGHTHTHTHRNQLKNPEKWWRARERSGWWYLAAAESASSQAVGTRSPAAAGPGGPLRTLCNTNRAQPAAGSGSQRQEAAAGGLTWPPGPPDQHVSVLLTQKLQRKEVLVPASCSQRSSCDLSRPPPHSPSQGVAAGTHRRSLDPRSRGSSSSPPPLCSTRRSSR